MQLVYCSVYSGPPRAFVPHIPAARVPLAVVDKDNPQVKDNLQTANKGPCTNLSSTERFHCIELVIEPGVQCSSVGI